MNSTWPARETGHDADQIARLLDRRAGRGANLHAHLVGDHVGERRLAQAGRPVQEHVIERFGAQLGGGNRDLQILADAVDVVGQHAQEHVRFHAMSEPVVHGSHL